MERFKTKLTMEQILEDYQTTNIENSKGGILAFTVLVLMIFPMLVLTICHHAVIASIILFVVLAACIAVLAFFIACLVKEQKTPKKKLGAEDFDIVEDYVVKIEKKSINETIHAYACFQKSGMIEINYLASGNYHRRPALGEVRVGDWFYVVAKKPGMGHLLYERKEWRLNDLTEEQLAAELREEDALIARIMECERFPQLTMHRDHYAEDGHLYQLDLAEQKADAEYNLMERLAIKHFFGDRLNAMEYLVRYCPAEIQRNAVKKMTKLQKMLAANILRHMKEDEKKADREERIEKIKSLFGRSDEL